MMKRLALPTLLALSLCTPVLAEGDGWSIDFAAAKKKAVAENKDLLVNFTGSDWCGFCIKLDQEVFSHDAFKKGVADSFVLVELDFPREQTLISEKTTAQNQKLAKHYRIGGRFPTILLTDAKGVPYSRTGYLPGGPQVYVKHLNELRAIPAERKRLQGIAASAEGEPKVALLKKALDLLNPADIDFFYAEEAAELIKLDPEDRTGFAAEQAKRVYQRAVSTFEQSVGPLLGAGKFDEALALTDQFLEKHDPQGEMRQLVLMNKVSVYVEQRNPKAAMDELEAIKSLDPDSEIGKRVDGLKDYITSFISEANEASEGESEGSGE